MTDNRLTPEAIAAIEAAGTPPAAAKPEPTHGTCTVPHLGLATTRQLLDEIRARIEIHFPGGLDYRTVDD